MGGARRRETFGRGEQLLSAYGVKAPAGVHRNAALGLRQGNGAASTGRIFCSILEKMDGSFTKSVGKLQRSSTVAAKHTASAVVPGDLVLNLVAILTLSVFPNNPFPR
jgi:hypothetical protein